MRRHFAAAGFLLLFVVLGVFITGTFVDRNEFSKDTLLEIRQARPVGHAGSVDTKSLEDAHITIYAFLATNCPISNASIPQLNRLHDAATDVDVVGIVPSEFETESSIREFADAYSVNFRIIHDFNREYTHRFRATHTPQVVVVDSRGFVAYTGALDDRYVAIAGQKRTHARQQFLEDAVAALRKGERPAIQTTDPVGCVIESLRGDGLEAEPVQSESAATTTVTFNRDVAPIIHRRCTACHREGEAAPFSLVTYRDVISHAEQIQQVVRDGSMPPWKPVAADIVFRNERKLTARERDLLENWFAAGMSEGTSSPPASPQFANGWQLGEPDLILTMPEEFSVPAGGPDIYQHFVIPIELTKGRLVNAVEFRPGAAEVVHHAFMYFDTTGTARKLDDADPGFGYENTGSPGFRVSGSLGGWGPGGIPQRLPAGLGRPLPANADLVLQIHYHPIGRAVQDQSQVGLYFAPETATHPVTEMMVADVDLKIPSGATNHHHQAEYVVPEDVVVFDCTPHMHTLGRRIAVTAICPDGRTIPVIKIDDWDFYWQETYAFFEPLKLPANTRIRLDCWFDNSAENPLNPNSPPQDIFWGDESTDEMGICYFRVTTQTASEYQRLNEHAGAYFSKMWERYQKESRERTALGPAVLP